LSTLAKVFVVINLICAVLLAASSATLFSLKKHWVEEYTKLDQRKSLEISSLTEEKNTIKVDLELKNTALAESKKDNEEMNTKYGSLKVQWDAQQKNIEGKGAELAEKETRLKLLDESIAVLNKQIEETRSSL
jgi:chromosome segregation ATPase